MWDPSINILKYMWCENLFDNVCSVKSFRLCEICRHTFDSMCRVKNWLTMCVPWKALDFVRFVDTHLTVCVMCKTYLKCVYRGKCSTLCNSSTNIWQYVWCVKVTDIVCNVKSFRLCVIRRQKLYRMYGVQNWLTICVPYKAFDFL